MSTRYIFSPEHPLYFATMTVVGWVDVFTRKDYIEIVYESWEYCCHEKGLIVHAYVIMSNHIHWVISSEKEALSDIVRDTKKFTSKQIVTRMREHAGESRRKWMLNLFDYAGKNQPNNSRHQFWRQDNRPIALWSPEVIRQKIDYIHANPVKAGIVDEPRHYRHSSARAYAGEDSLFPVQPLLFPG